MFTYLSVDNGNKKGNESLTKFISWYDIKAKCVIIFMLDCDYIVESTKKSTWESNIHLLDSETQATNMDNHD